MANDLNINVGGVWKSIDTASINVAGVWKTPDSISINVAGVWKTVWQALSVIVAANKFISDIEFPPTAAYAWVGVNSDGDLKSSTTGATPNVAYETWLDAGLNTQVWVQASISGSALTSGSDATGSRLACSTSRAWGYSTTGIRSGTLTLDFYDAATGGSLLDSQAVFLSADASGA